MKESYGDLTKLEELGKGKRNSFTTEQLINENLKNVEGESRKEVTYRMKKVFKSILEENKGKKIAIVSHGAAIKFLIMKWCKLNENNEIEFNKQKITLDSPGIIKLVFEEDELLELIQVDFK